MATINAMKMISVPSVYAALKKEASKLNAQMIAGERGTPEYLGFKMSHWEGDPEYTPFAVLWTGLSSGASQALRLMPRQALLWTSLFARHFAVTENCSGNHGFIILAGPPDVR